MDLSIYLVDDHTSILDNLIYLIEDTDLGRIVGSTTNPLLALDEISILKPDIVIIDYLMPEMDGATLAMQVRDKLPNIGIIMLTAVDEKAMVASAYESGIDHYIIKPINRMEVLSVLKIVGSRLDMQSKLETIGMVISNRVKVKEETNETENLLGILGLKGKTGYRDILDVLEKVEKEKTSIREIELTELLGNKTKIQRIRRCAKSALINMAYLGIEDNMNEIFVKYGSALFGYKALKNEMDYIRGKRLSGGKVSAKDFLINLTENSHN